MKIKDVKKIELFRDKITFIDANGNRETHKLSYEYCALVDAMIMQGLIKLADVEIKEMV